MKWQKLKCLFGQHKAKFFDMDLLYFQQVLMKCDCCGKYGIWQTGINCRYWAKSVNELPKVVREYIEENNL